MESQETFENTGIGQRKETFTGRSAATRAALPFEDLDFAKVIIIAHYGKICRVVFAKGKDAEPGCRNREGDVRKKTHAITF